MLTIYYPSLVSMVVLTSVLFVCSIFTGIVAISKKKNGGEYRYYAFSSILGLLLSIVLLPCFICGLCLSGNEEYSIINEDVNISDIFETITDISENTYYSCIGLDSDSLLNNRYTLYFDSDYIVKHVIKKKFWKFPLGEIVSDIKDYYVVGV